MIYKMQDSFFYILAECSFWWLRWQDRPKWHLLNERLMDSIFFAFSRVKYSQMIGYVAVSLK